MKTKLHSLIFLVLISSVALGNVEVDDDIDQDLKVDGLVQVINDVNLGVSNTTSGPETESTTTSNVTEDGSGSGSEETTTQLVTTSTTSPTTTRPPQQLPDIDGLFYYMNLSLSFASGCADTSNCSEYDGVITNLLREVFAVQVDLGFRDISVNDYVSDDTGYYATANTIVKYSAQYNLQKAIENTADIENNTIQVVFNNLTSRKINGSEIIEEYLTTTAIEELNAAIKEVESYETNLCLYLGESGEEFCEFGHQCVRANETGLNETDPSVLFGSTCQYLCVTYISNCDEDYGICIINTKGSAECACGDDALQISSTNCFPQNHLIFVCAVGGGILLIAVVVLLSILLCRSQGDDEETDRISKLSAKDILYHERYEADDGFGMPRASRAEERGSTSTSGSVGPSTFTGNPKHNERPNHRHSHAHHNKAYDWDDTEKVQLEDLESDRRRQSRQAPYDPYYQDLVESDSYREFRPSLDHIDHDKVYAFRRPMFSSQSGEGSSKKYDRRWEDTD